MKTPDFPGFFRNLARFAAYCGQRFASDQCLRIATQLSYASLLAVVPVLAICFGLLSAFPGFEHLRQDAQVFLFENLVPNAGVEVSDQLATFVDNARSMTGLGSVALAATALFLLSTINGAFNTIWRVTEPRPLMVRIMAYWMVLTIGPIFFGISLSLSSYGFATTLMAEGDRAFGLTRLLPFVLTASAFTVIYAVVPARNVAVRHAVIGGVVAALLSELLKAGFAAYLKQFPSYEVIYGAMASIPIFLIWMYLSWAVVLFGAEIAAAAPEWRLVDRLRGARHGSGPRLALALALLHRLRSAARAGTVLKESALTRGLPAGLDELSVVMLALRKHGFVSRANGRWILSRDLTAANLEELLRALELNLDPGEGWPDGVESIVLVAGQMAAEVRGKSLAVLLDEAADIETPDGVARLHPLPRDEG
ncbi:YihY family inner membrane protein [Pelagibius litoralis]|uniref:UPF0761 membrane protein HBA54_16150 n=1 Tax=Pelagibius litoralis TaxID=374515 RepID=A0A967KB15_9PROT|nr:YihY family inner membrane protein [Pelagibius litoralis]NIA70139.1 YihY family inner membrane protein [Pelagibius litoralis]